MATTWISWVRFALVERAQDVAADAAVAVDCNFDGHDASLGTPDEERLTLE